MGDLRRAQLAAALAARRGGGFELRLFFALTVPDEQTIVIEKSLQPIRLVLPQVRWIPRENWHLTLCFLGEVDDARIGDVRELGGKAAQGGFAPSLELRGIGAFPSPKRARVLWVGVNDEDERTALLAATLGRLTAEVGFGEQKRFKAHLTVARLKTPKDISDVAAQVSVDSEPFRCKQLTLFSSIPGPKGSTYEIVDQWPLPERSGVL